MTTDNPTLFDAINAVVQSSLGRMRIIGVGTVEGYDPDSQSATIQSAIQFAYIDEAREVRVPYTPTPVSNVPVLHPSAGGFFSAMPVKAGDQGVILTADRALDSWKASGGTNNEVTDRRRFDLADSLFLPCGNSLAKAIANLDTGNEKWVWGEDSPAGIRFKLGDGKFEWGTPVVSFMEQLVNALAYAKDTAQFASSATVATVFGPQPLSTAGQLVAQAVQLAQARALINLLKGDL